MQQQKAGRKILQLLFRFELRGIRCSELHPQWRLKHQALNLAVCSNRLQIFNWEGQDNGNDG